MRSLRRSSFHPLHQNQGFAGQVCPLQGKPSRELQSLPNIQKSPTTSKTYPKKINSNYTSNDVSNNVIYVNNTNVEATQQHISNANIPPKSSKSCAQAAFPNNSSPTPNSSINDSTLLNFLKEFKSLIYPLLSLLSTVLDHLLKPNAN